MTTSRKKRKKKEDAALLAAATAPRPLKLPRITIIDYNEQSYTERVVETVDECGVFKDMPSVTWINIDGLKDPAVIERIGQMFNLHPLVIDDIQTVGQRPKYEDYEDYLFVQLKMLTYDMDQEKAKAEQVSIVVTSRCVITFQEHADGDVFDMVRGRIRNAKGRIRKMGPDYLAYSMLDAVVDHYFVILERFDEYINVLEGELVTDPSPDVLTAIYELKNEMLFLRKAAWPMREIVSGLQRVESLLMNEITKLYLRDVYDHTVQISDTVETYRDMVTGMLDVYLSTVSYKMNEVMKVLTMIATIFIPLTFIAGLYGMNFNTHASPLNMPELNWPYGYLFALTLMIAVAVGMLTFFRRKRWI